ncbi:hypothetical protein TRFO_35667 [Tritrichomonas foetus]|uniref:Uncharacterized protein n=1 Tax=Tritrichomonas foetus TaxID=1144522 RepID=A0A1J4JI69_9EUKA|nr:hypothetical protein TRFO_35667 [Tritrichomonas foetus]|eukprot:OHS98023.1 hypothetical protein TRFO_35667 [Tritrichomonas foetus]
MWFGLQNVIPTLLLLQDMYKINSPSESLDQLFPDHKCISISNLSINLVLLFFALQANTLDIKKIGQFLSRHNKRLKTTLCKLYQITFILDAAGILSKGDNIGEIVLNPRFFALRMPMKEEPKIDILSIESLLNRPRNAPVNYIQCRNQDFEMFAKLIGESLIEI